MVIHDWDDERAAAILKKCRTAVGTDGRVLLLERVISSGANLLEVAFSDLEMLVGPGGRERTTEEFRSLLAEAGFELSRIVPLEFSYNIVEGVPA
jgi:hypothetical protein